MTAPRPATPWTIRSRSGSRELSPYFGIEVGWRWTTRFGALFTEGFVSVTPFVGVTLYVYDESGA